MFIGALPKPACAQMMQAIPFANYPAVYVVGSGSFRIEQALCQLGLTPEIHSCDVAIIPCAVGALAATVDCFPYEFTDEMEFANPLIEGMPALHRAAALFVADQMGSYTGPGIHAMAHRKHYQREFLAYCDKTAEWLATMADTIHLESFEARDLRLHAAMAASTSSPVIGCPPFRKGRYERIYRWLDRQVKWERPDYTVWSPAELPRWLDELADLGVPFCIASDQVLAGHKLVGAHYAPTGKPIFLYGNIPGDAGVSRKQADTSAFKYDTLDPVRLTEHSEIKIAQVTPAEFRFVTDRFVPKSLGKVVGMLNFLVFVDGSLAGGFSYRKADRDAEKALFLLCDFAVARTHRLSKLIAALATIKDSVRPAEYKLVTRFERVETVAFTDKPCSMKYRGCFGKEKNRKGCINYAARVRPDSAGSVYADWWRRHGAPSGPTCPSQAP